MTSLSTRAVLATALLVTLSLPAMAQTSPAMAQTSQRSMSQSDLDRLQIAVNDAADDIEQLRGRDSQLASTLTRELNELRDEVAYLRVKLRREKQVARGEYVDLRDRIDDLRLRARTTADGASTTGSTTTGRRSSSAASDIPVGTELDVRLQDALSSERNQVEDRFLATTVVDLQADGRVLIPAGSELRGVVSSVEKAGRLDRKGSMRVTFDEITVDGESYPMRGMVVEALEGEGLKGEAVKLGTAAGLGGIIGGVLGGAKGALLGVLIGGGGMVAATPGTDVELEPGTILRIRLDEPPAIR